MSEPSHNSNAEPRWFRRHPGLALLAMNALAFLVIAGILEVGLRLFIPYNPGFYTAVSATSRELVHPYGIIKINSDGFPDDEFDLTRSHKVGYFGDSVTYGVGAGYPYRISEVLEEAYPEHEHMNVGGIGLSISDSEIGWATDLASKYGMETVIYLFNLNDILPSRVASGEERIPLVRLKDFVLQYIDWLRGTSYLYTAIRNQLKTALAARGYGFHGYSAFELFPEEHAEIVRETSERINRFGRSLAERDVELIVVILPYEMQISKQAEEVYASKGIQWESGFLAGMTQEILMDSLESEIPVFDAFYAFVDADDPESSRAAIGVGEYFVFDKGDKLDWNHPNRAGHRAIAEFLIEQEVLGPTAFASKTRESAGR